MSPFISFHLPSGSESDTNRPSPPIPSLPGLARTRALSPAQPWFDEGTRRKVHVLGKDPGPALRTLIDPKDLPKPYGGELDWQYEDDPRLDDAAAKALGEAGMPRGPCMFVDGVVTRPVPSPSS